MTVSTTASRISYTGDDTTDALSFPYPVQAEGDLVVVETVIATGVETTQTITTDYTVSIAGDGSSATVTPVATFASTTTWTIYRDPAVTQTTDYQDNDSLPAASIEDMADKNVMIAQRLSDRIDRTLEQPEGDTVNIGALPSKVDRASKYLLFDANGNPTVSTGTGTVSSVSTSMIEDDAVTLAKLAAGTDGELITWDANGDPATVPVGTSGHVLTSNGAGAAPTFQANAGLADGAVTTAKLADDAVTLAKMAAGTDGELITWDAAGDPATVAVGTSGHVLTSNGAGAAPTFQAVASAGAWEFISSTDVSGTPSTIDLTGFNASSYDAYVIIFSNIRSSSDAALVLRTSTDGGSTFDTTGYEGVITHTTPTTVSPGSSGSTYIEIAEQIGTNGEESGSGIIWIMHPHLTAYTHIISHCLQYNASTAVETNYTCGARESAADVDAVRLFWTTGSFEDRGTISFYGIKNA